MVVFSFSVNDKLLLTSKRGKKKKKTNPVYLCLFCISLSFDIVSKFINFKSATILCFWVLYLIKFQPNLDSLNPEIETQITKD